MYKRQVASYSLAAPGADRRNGVVADDLLEVIGYAVFIEILERFKPVSDTHLDVYKRQLYTLGDTDRPAVRFRAFDAKAQEGGDMRLQRQEQDFKLFADRHALCFRRLDYRRR